jgi:hypothetical protein
MIFPIRIYTASRLGDYYQAEANQTSPNDRKPTNLKDNT